MLVEYTLTGHTALLMHADDVEASDTLKEWRDDPKNKNISVAGDDRSPAWTWHTYLYTDGENLVMPVDNIMVCLRKAGAKLIMKKQTTFKEATQNGFIPAAEYAEFLSGGKPVPVAPIYKLRDLPFKQQAERAAEMGFSLFVKRAKVGQAKHVRVRPRFEVWQVKGLIEVDTVTVPELTFQVTEKIFHLAGWVGLCDWRPGSPKSPGSYGMFTSKLKLLEK